jgi:UDP-glucose 4-epimerase
VHLAAVSRAAPAEADPELAYDVNVAGTRNLLEALESVGSRAWFVFASSREVYGEPDHLPVDERHPLRPKGRYGVTKTQAEAVVRSICDNASRPAAILRFTNLYGDPADYPERVVPAFVSAALHGEVLNVRGPDLRLDLLHREDAVRAILDTIRYLEGGGSALETVNIASGHGITLGELATLVVGLTGSKSRIQPSAPVDWAPSGYIGNISKAAELLSWRPEIGLEEGLKRLVHEYRTTSGELH